MSLRFSFVGDSLSALGYALLGAQRYSPPLEEPGVLQALSEARRESDLVVIQVEYAALLGTQLTQLIVTHPRPPVVVVPALHEDAALPTHTLDQARLVLGVG